MNIDITDLVKCEECGEDSLFNLIDKHIRGYRACMYVLKVNHFASTSKRTNLQSYEHTVADIDKKISILYDMLAMVRQMNRLDESPSTKWASMMAS